MPPPNRSKKLIARKHSKNIQTEEEIQPDSPDLKRHAILWLIHKNGSFMMTTEKKESKMEDRQEAAIFSIFSIQRRTTVPKKWSPNLWKFKWRYRKFTVVQWKIFPLPDIESAQIVKEKEEQTPPSAKNARETESPLKLFNSDLE